ncbi:MAG: Hpt domain-containing protein, partial [Terracidiphilus sp.]
ADLAAAADGYLSKPFSAPAFGQFLESRRQRKEAGSTPEPSLPGDPVISPATLAQLRSLMPPSAVREIYAALVADMADRLDTLEAALAAGDSTELGRAAHAIKGSCAMAGALQAARVAARLESQAGGEGDQLDNSARLIAELRSAHLALKSMLEAEFPA